MNHTHRPLNFVIIPLLLSASVFQVRAYDGDITRCVDANGNVTFTDNFCVTVEITQPIKNPQKYALQNHSALSLRSEILEVNNNAAAIVTTELSALSESAQKQCIDRFPRFFLRRYRDAVISPDANFDVLLDQFEDAGSVSFTLAGLVEYIQSSHRVLAQVECTVQKWQSKSEWLVGFAVKELQ